MPDIKQFEITTTIIFTYSCNYYFIEIWKTNIFRLNSGYVKI